MSPSFWQILIIVAVVAILFGSKRLRHLGSDLGTSIKGFKKAMKEEKPNIEQNANADDDFIDAEKTALDKKIADKERAKASDNED